MKRIELVLETILFNSRWLLAPFYFGLVLGLGLVLFHSLAQFFEFALSIGQAKERDVIVRGNSLIVDERPFVTLLPGDRRERVMCRMRSLGCSPCTGAVRSTADTIPKIIEELIQVRHSERQLRVIDHDQDGSMELKKREGYF